MGRGARGPGPAGRAPPGGRLGPCGTTSSSTATAGHLGRPRLGHRPLQLPLPVLHARRRPALAPARRGPVVRGARARRRVLASMGVDTSGSPAASRSSAATSRAWPRCSPPSPASTSCRSRPTASCSSATPRRWWRPGSTRFNVSIDSLQRDRFFAMTRRDALPPRAARPRGARRVPRGAPDQGQRRRHARLHRGRGRCPSRASPASTPTRCASSSSCRSTPTTPGRPTASSPATRSARPIHAVFPLEPEPREPHATARVYRFADGHGRIGFINPVSEPFCGDCDRIRLTAEGQLRTCLFSLHETDLRAPLRAGRERRRARARSSATRSGARSSSTTSTSPASSSPRGR